MGKKKVKHDKRAERKQIKVMQNLTSSLYWEALRNSEEIIVNFPTELWILIFTYLPTASVIRMRFTSRFFHFLLTNARHDRVSTEVPLSVQRKHKKKSSPYTKVISEKQLLIYQEAVFKHIDFSNPDYFAQVWRSRENYLLPYNYAKVLGCTSKWYIEDPHQPWMNQYAIGENRMNVDCQFARMAYAMIREEDLINIILEFAPLIETLQLSDCDAVTDAVIGYVVQYCTNLKKLIVRGCCCVTELSLEHVLLSPIMHKNLEVFDFTECPCVSFATLGDIELLKPFQKLTTLAIDKDDVEHFGNFITNLRNERLDDLKALKKYESYSEVALRPLLFKETIPFMPEKFSHFCHTLTELNLHTGAVFGSTVYTLTYMFPNLEIIRLQTNSYSPVPHYVPNERKTAAKNNTTLKTLHVEIDTEDDTYMMDLPQFYPNLRDVSFSRLSAANTDAMAKFMNVHHELEICSLSPLHLQFFKTAMLHPKVSTLALHITEPEVPNNYADTYNLWGGQSAKFFLQYGKQLKNLVFSIARRYDTGSEARYLMYTPILSAIRQSCFNLEELHLTGVGLDARAPEELFLWDFPIHLPHLRVLMLDNIELKNISANFEESKKKIVVEPMESNLETVSVGKVDVIWLQLLCHRVNKLRHLNIGSQITLSDEIISGLITAENAPRIRTLSCPSMSSVVEILEKHVSDLEDIDLEGLAWECTTAEGVAAAVSLLRKSGPNLINLNCNQVIESDDIFAACSDYCPNVRFLIAQSPKNPDIASEFIENLPKNLRTVRCKTLFDIRDSLPLFDWFSII